MHDPKNILSTSRFVATNTKNLGFTFDAIFDQPSSSIVCVYIYMRWVQVTPGVTLVKLHIFYTVDL